MLIFHVSFLVSPHRPPSGAGLALGTAFQIRDDVLNLAGDPHKYGKEIGGDLLEGKRTLIVLHWLARAPEEQRVVFLDQMRRDRADKDPAVTAQIHRWLLEGGSVAYAQDYAQRQAQEGLNIKHDISVAVSRIPDFVRETDAALAQAFAGVRMVNYGHLGDGNLHYNVQAPEGCDPAAFLASHEKPVNTMVYAAVQRYQGSLSAEHGIGSLKREKLAQYKSPVALALMRSIKLALDPHNLMNPGRIFTLHPGPEPHDG